MKKKRSSGKGNFSGRQQGRYCTNDGFGQGRGRNCDYGQRQRQEHPQTVRSILEAIFTGLNRLIDRSQQTIALLTNKSGTTHIGGKEADKLLRGRKPQFLADKRSNDRAKQIADEK